VFTNTRAHAPARCSLRVSSAETVTGFVADTVIGVEIVLLGELRVL
jgi:hypothetical protein